MIILGITGQQQWNDHLAKLMLFRLETDTRMETLVNYNALKGDQTAMLNTIPARSDTMIDLGKWTQFTTNKFGPGTLFKLYGENMAAFTSQHKKAAQYFILRDGAALRRFSIPLHESKGVLREAYVQTNCDLLTLDQAIDEGAPTPRHVGFRNLHETAAVARLFRITEVEPEAVRKQVVARVRVRNAAGETVAIPTVTRVRKVKY